MAGIAGMADMARAKRWLLGALLAVPLTLSGSGSGSAASQLPSSPSRQLSFLHVGGASGPSNLPQVVDASGREVLLKGLNVDGIVDYYRGGTGTKADPKALQNPYSFNPSDYINGKCVPDVPSVEGVPICSFDFAQMRPLGYDVIRLNLSWSLLEPQPGVIDKTYIARIQQVVDWAGAAGIYVLLDMHQDAWSKYVYSTPADNCNALLTNIQGYDGAPRWASSHTLPACALHGTRELDAAVAEDFQKFYLNAPGPDGVGLQDHYASVLVALAAQFRNQPGVAGYEIINEPHPGFAPIPQVFEATELFPFYAHVIKRVTDTFPGFKQLVFIEPDALRNVTDAALLAIPWSVFSPYRNVVFAPHIYTGVFTADTIITQQRFFPKNGGYNSSISDAKNLGLPLWIGEFGNSPSDDNTILRNHYLLQDQDQVGGAIWLWKENANDIFSNASWGIYKGPFGPGAPRPSRIKFTDRAYPLFTAGHLRSFSYDPDHPGFDLQAVLPPGAQATAGTAGCTPVGFGDRNHATVIFVPASVTSSITATGARLQVFDRGGGSREVYVYPTASPYHVFSETPSQPLPAPAVQCSAQAGGASSAPQGTTR